MGRSWPGITDHCLRNWSEVMSCNVHCSFLLGFILLSLLFKVTVITIITIVIINIIIIAWHGASTTYIQDRPVADQGWPQGGQQWCCWKNRIEKGRSFAALGPLQPEKWVRICERKSSANPKISSEQGENMFQAL